MGGLSNNPARPGHVWVLLAAIGTIGVGPACEAPGTYAGMGGELVWANETSLEGGDTAEGLAVGGEDHSALLSGSTDMRMFVRGFAGDGRPQWTSFAATDGFAYTVGLVVTPRGTVRAAGLALYGIVFDELTIAETGSYVVELDRDGRFVDATFVDPGIVSAIATVSDGYVLAGWGTDGAYMARYGDDGIERWRRLVAGRRSVREPSVAVRQDGGLLVAGGFSSRPEDVSLLNDCGADRALIVSIWPTGECDWFVPEPAELTLFASGIAVGGGSIAVTGEIEGTAKVGAVQLDARGGTDVFVAVLSEQGTVLWADRYGGEGNDAGRAVVVDPFGDVTVVGRFERGIDFGGGDLGSAGDADGFVAKFTATGDHVWSRSLGSVDDDVVSEVVADVAGNIFVAGSFAGRFDIDGETLHGFGTDAFVAVFAP